MNQKFNRLFTVAIMGLVMTSFVGMELAEAKSRSSYRSSSRRSSYSRPKSVVRNIHQKPTTTHTTTQKKVTQDHSTQKATVGTHKPTPQVQAQKVDTTSPTKQAVTTKPSTTTKTWKKSSTSSALVPLGLLYLATRTSPNHKKVPKSCVCSNEGVPQNCPADVRCEKNPNAVTQAPEPTQ